MVKVWCTVRNQSWDPIPGSYVAVFTPPGGTEETFLYGVQTDMRGNALIEEEQGITRALQGKHPDYKDGRIYTVVFSSDHTLNVVLGSPGEPEVPECMTNSDCPTGQICDNGKCVEETPPPPPPKTLAARVPMMPQLALKLLYKLRTKAVSEEVHKKCHPVI